MRIAPFLAAVAVALAASPLAAAACDGIQALPFVLVSADTGQGKFYLYYDGGCDPTCHGPDWWVFEESNGIAGLQYNDFFGHGPERCGGATEDTVVL